MPGLTASSDEFGTPRWLFDLLNREFQFTIDACASAVNAKMQPYISKEQDAFEYRGFHGQRVFCNPPYSRGMKERFARLAYDWTDRAMPYGSDLWVLLLPTCTDQAWFHELVRPPRAYWYPIRGRIKFDGGETGARDSHMIVVFRNKAFCEFERNWPGGNDGTKNN